MNERQVCGYAVIDIDGSEQPCDRTATGWRWYQDVEHEDVLDPACDWHANEGGRRIHDAEAALARVEALAVKWQVEVDEARAHGTTNPKSAKRAHVKALRAALADPTH